MSNNFSSIYQKCCPACMASNPQTAIQCACGHRFDSAQAPLAQALEDEKLYEAYLAARVEQARQALDVARAVLGTDPASETNKNAAAQASEAWKDAQVQLQAQCARTEALARAARVVPPAGPAAASPAASAPVADSKRPGAFVHSVPRLIRRVATPQTDAVVQAAKALKKELTELRVHGGRLPKPVKAPAKKAEPKAEPDKAKAKNAQSQGSSMQSARPAARGCPDCGAELRGGTCGCAGHKVTSGLSHEMAQRFPGLYQAYLQESHSAKAPDQARASEPVAPTAGPQRRGPAADELRPARAGNAGPALTQLPETSIPVPTTPHTTVLPIVQHGPVATPAAVDPEVAGRARLAREVEVAAQRAQVARTKECPHCTAVLPEQATQCKCGMSFPKNGQATVMPGLTLGPDEAIRLSDLYRR